MKKNTTKLQLTLPTEVVKRIDLEISENFSTRSSWFLKLALKELKEKEKKGNAMKKIIDLDV